MQIQVKTDRHIDGNEARITRISGVLERTLDRHSGHITRIEVHVSDENSDRKGGNDDMRCVIEARLERLQPIAVRHQAGTVEEAVDGAAAKLLKMIDSRVGRVRGQRRRGAEPLSPEPAPQGD